MIKHLVLFDSSTKEIEFECDYDDVCTDVEDILRNQYELDFCNYYNFDMSNDELSITPCVEFTIEYINELGQKLTDVYENVLDDIAGNIEIRCSWINPQGQNVSEIEPLKSVLDNMMYGFEGAFYSAICDSITMFLEENDWQWGFRNSQGRIVNIIEAFPEPTQNQDHIIWMLKGEEVEPVIWYGKSDSINELMELTRDCNCWTIIDDDGCYELDSVLPEDDSIKQAYYYYIAEYGSDALEFDYSSVKKFPFRSDWFLGDEEKLDIDSIFLDFYQVCKKEAQH